MPGYRRAYRTARRLYPVALAAYHRWESLTEEEKERYMRHARRVANQAAGYARGAAARAPRMSGRGGGRSKRGR